MKRREPMVLYGQKPIRRGMTDHEGDGRHQDSYASEESAGPLE